MSTNSRIEWTDHTFNPWWGCTAVSPACDHCYAEGFAKRVGFSETGSKFPIWGKDAERRFFGDKYWSAPVKWDKAAAKSGRRARVFCGSMCDVMEEYAGTAHLVSENILESREWLYRLIGWTPNLDWLLLTKRPQNFKRFLPSRWVENPQPNVCGMTTVESRDYLWRVDALQCTPFASRALSCEPLLGELDIEHQLARGGIHQVICGGESGPGARPMPVEWARSLRDQCQRTGVAFFMKQLSQANTRQFKEFDKFPADLQVRESHAATA